MNKKARPVVKGPLDGNAYNIIGAVTTALTKAGDKEGAKMCLARCFSANSYNELLSITMEYVDFEDL